MTTSSALPDYSITSSDTITISTLDTSTFGNITVSNNTGSSYYHGGGASTSTVTIGGITGYTLGSGLTSSGTISVAPLTVDQITSFTLPVDWQDRFPDWDKVKKMCEEYPGLKIAFEKFQTTYKLVVDHYDTPEDKRPKP